MIFSIRYHNYHVTPLRVLFRFPDSGIVYISLLNNEYMNYLNPQRSLYIVVYLYITDWDSRNKNIIKF